MAHRSRHPKTIGTTRWAASALSFNGISAGSSALTALAAGTPAETILRTRGTGLCMVDGVQAPVSLVLVSMGLVLVPEGTGTTVIWDPVNDPNAPWFWFKEVFVGYEEAVTDVIDMPGLSVSRYDIDSKAMRKANEDEEVQFVMVNTTISGARAVNVHNAFRFLVGH